MASVRKRCGPVWKLWKACPDLSFLQRYASAAWSKDFRLDERRAAEILRAGLVDILPGGGDDSALAGSAAVAVAAPSSGGGTAKQRCSASW